MKKCILLSVVLFIIGCNAYRLPDGTVVQGQENIPPGVVAEKVDPLVIAEDTAAAFAPLATAAAGPVGGAVIGAILVGLRMARKHRPVVAELQKDALALVEVVKGIKNAKGGGGDVGAISPSLASSLNTETSTETKARIKAIEATV